jgi:xanthine/CO dehydrogenase XdhC/CoxF family maturation factor
VRELLAGDAPFTISTVLSGDAAGRVTVRTGAGETAVTAADGAEVFTEALRPPPHLLVFGAGDDALPLVRLAADAGFRVSLVDHRPGYLAEGRFPPEVRRFGLRAEGEAPLRDLPLGRHSYAVVKTHSLAHDREWVRRLLATEVAYVGVLGPRARVQDLLDQLGATGDRRVHGPVGLDLGADGPEQVAVSVVAELLAIRARREPRHLRERKGTIHGP